MFLASAIMHNMLVSTDPPTIVEENGRFMLNFAAMDSMGIEEEKDTSVTEDEADDISRCTEERRLGLIRRKEICESFEQTFWLIYPTWKPKNNN